VRWEDATVIVATGLAWWALVPQIRKLARTGDPTGISTTWPAIGLVSNAAWTAYLVSQALWAAAPSTAVMVIFYVLVLRALGRVGSHLSTPLRRGTAWAVILFGLLAFGGWTTLGLALGWAYVLQLAPAVVAAFRTPEPTGVSAGTWSMIGVEAALWLTYGGLHSDVPVMIYGTVGIGAAVLILGRLAVTGTIRTRSAQRPRLQPPARR